MNTTSDHQTPSDYTDYRPYPNIKQAWILLLVIMAAQMIASMWMLVFDDGSSMGIFLTYSTGMALALICMIALRKASESPWRPIFQSDPVPASVYLSVLIAIPAMMMVSGPVANLIPVPEIFEERLKNIVENTGIMTTITLAIAAPIFEELIFRGIILDGLLRNVSPKKAIIHSAIIFSIAHMNPVQVPQTLLLGAFIGWVYYRTRSIWPCIFIHFINNGSIALLLQSVDMEAAASVPEPDISPWVFLAVVPVGVAVIYGVVRVIKEQVPTLPIWMSSSEEE